jgi:hypothetical protein
MSDFIYFQEEIFFYRKQLCFAVLLVAPSLSFRSEELAKDATVRTRSNIIYFSQTYDDRNTILLSNSHLLLGT